MLSQIKPLTQEERQLAHAAAEEAVMRDIGERPQRDHYNHHAAHRYPPLVTKLITGLCIALLLAAFTPSAIRLYVIGSQTFGAAVPYEEALEALGTSDWRALIYLELQADNWYEQPAPELQVSPVEPEALSEQRPLELSANGNSSHAHPNVL